ncbi:MAG: hypothetical protein VKM98_08035 [Cyanobacteriota bacterium]|nr:hypothetical protein [Cyanobacteriota bacterium]
MDVSQAILDIIATYGSGDSTKPSLNRPRHVKHGSSTQALDLGVLDEQDLLINGIVGSESGSSTIFYRFKTDRLMQVAARIVPVEISPHGPFSTASPQASRPAKRGDSSDSRDPFSPLYLYLAVSLTDQNGKPIETGFDSFTPLAARSEGPSQALVASGIGYVADNYWQAGYAEQDGVTVGVVLPIFYFSEFDPIVIQGLLDTQTVQTQTVLGSISTPPLFIHLPIEPALAPLKAPVQSNGEFTLAVSSSQWPAIAYTLQLALRVPKRLRGTILRGLDGQGRLPIRALQGDATLTFDALGRIPRRQEVEGPSLVQLLPSGLLQRTSPFA